MAEQSLTPQQREQLAAAAKRTPAAPKEPEQLVYVWPHLVTIEFIAAMLMLLSLVLMSWVVQAPLEGVANADKTPNPSKAPWYFLNLQELLLHMHPALAGVLVPAGALALIAIIPYFDRDQRDVGKWFGTRNAGGIALFTAFYTAIIIPALIFFDEYIGVKPLMRDLSQSTGSDFFREQIITDIIIPVALMVIPIGILLWIVKRKWDPTTRDVMVCLFTGFFVAYIVLTIFGTFFRGQGMHLYWPWDARMQRID
ncbi:MAG: menaquinol-cytochrome C reductase [Chloroflexi bacterium]|nr:menaquinol-cytochrome C reductase [Chloroflexota bacterium]